MADQLNGAAEQPAASILDSITAAFAEHEQPSDPAPEAPASAETPEAPAGSDRPRDEKGRFAAKGEEPDATPEAKPEAEGTAPAAEKEATEPTEPEAQPGAIEPPHHWSAEDKAWLISIPESHRASVLDRFKKMEAGFTPKLQRAAELDKTWGEVEKFFDPFKEQMQRGGWTAPSLVKAWADMEVRLSKEPEKAIQDIAKFYKVDLSKFGAPPQTVDPRAVPEEQAPVDPVIQALQEEIAALKGTVSGFTEAQQQEAKRQQDAQLQRSLDEIQAFADAKGEDGSPSHPFFNDVMQDILVLAQAERAAGRAPVLKDIYDKAVWANPETRQKQLAATQAEAERKRVATEKAKAEAARKAGSSVTGTPSGGGQAPTSKTRGSLRDDILAAVDDLD